MSYVAALFMLYIRDKYKAFVCFSNTVIALLPFYLLKEEEVGPNPALTKI